jgi:hypothetical protein
VVAVLAVLVVLIAFINLNLNAIVLLSVCLRGSRYNNTCFPCEWKASEVIPGSRGNWTGIASVVGEDQMAAFVHHNGPIWIGINSHVFGLRDNATNQVLACNGTVDGGGGSPENCFITPKMCADGRISKQIDHAVTVVGYGVDAEHGAYWQVSMHQELLRQSSTLCTPAEIDPIGCGN